VGGPTVGAAPDANWLLTRPVTAEATVGAMASGDVLLDCTNYTFTCSPDVVTLHNTIADAQWQGTTPGGAVWSMINCRGASFPTGGAWALKRALTPTSVFYEATGWNGRGSQVFVAHNGVNGGCAASPVSVTVVGSCL